MIALSDPTTGLDHDLLNAAGGFAWWYVDLLDADHNGCVIIWSFGLPFLPGRESRARSGEGTPCRQEPSLNVVLYRNGRPIAYVLQRHPEQGATWQPGTEHVTIGRSVLTTARDGDRRRCHLQIDLDMPDGSRLEGQVEVVGPACRFDPVGQDPRHQWSPLCTAATGSAMFTVDGAEYLSVQGRAYHDRNGSTVPLAGLDIRHWLWGRAPVGDQERIWYLLWPKVGQPVAWGLTVAADGAVTLHDDLEVERSGPRLGRFGMPWWRAVRLQRDGKPWMQVHHDRLVDNGFFYQRWLTRVTGPDGQQSVGTAEAVRPGRVDRWWNRWLVSMAVHRVHQPNSPFLPLFSNASSQKPRQLPTPVEAP